MCQDDQRFSFPISVFLASQIKKDLSQCRVAVYMEEALLVFRACQARELSVNSVSFVGFSHPDIFNIQIV